MLFNTAENFDKKVPFNDEDH